MTLQQLIYFREVAKQRHFTRAADNLFVSQSSLSHAIRQLEEELSVPLFIRQVGKAVELTQFGEVLLHYSNRILNDLDLAKAEIDQLRDPAGGIVNIVYSYFNGYSLIPGLLKAFRSSPCSNNIDVRVEINHGHRFFEQETGCGNVDITFSAGDHFEGLTSIPVAKQELFVMIPAGDPLSERPSVTLEDLQDHQLLIYLEGRHLHRWIQKMYEYSGLTMDVAAFFDDWSTMMGTVALGEGIVIGPKLPVDTDVVKIVQLDHPMKIRNIYMHYQADIKLSRAVRTFRDFCIEYFTSLNGGSPISK